MCEADMKNFDSSIYLKGVNKSNKYFTWVKYTMNLIIDKDYFKKHDIDITKTYEDLPKASKTVGSMLTKINTGIKSIEEGLGSGCIASINSKIVFIPMDEAINMKREIDLKQYSDAERLK